MILFWSIAAALTVAALAFLLPPLLRHRSVAPDARDAANVALYREQLEELGAELRKGTLAREEFERASRDIERRIVAEHGGASAPEPARRRAPVAAALAVGLLLPLAAAVGYWQVGEPRGLQAEALRSADPRHLQALARAVQLAPEDRELLVEFIKALALAGRAEFEQRNYAAAIGYWDRILPFAPPESEFARTVSDSIAEARALAGGAAPALKSVQGVVSLDPKLRAKVSPGDTVFVLARPATGSRMPLAVLRTTVDKLPYSFSLDDSMAMAPGAELSGHPQVIVAARISKSGSAMPQKGDIEGLSAAVAPGANGVAVVMSRVLD